MFIKPTSADQANLCKPRSYPHWLQNPTTCMISYPMPVRSDAYSIKALYGCLGAGGCACICLIEIGCLREVMYSAPRLEIGMHYVGAISTAARVCCPLPAVYSLLSGIGFYCLLSTVYCSVKYGLRCGEKVSKRSCVTPIRPR